MKHKGNVIKFIVVFVLECTILKAQSRYIGISTHVFNNTISSNKYNINDTILEHLDSQKNKIFDCQLNYAHKINSKYNLRYSIEYYKNTFELNDIANNFKVKEPNFIYKSNRVRYFLAVEIGTIKNYDSFLFSFYTGFGLTYHNPYKTTQIRNNYSNTTLNTSSKTIVEEPKSIEIDYLLNIGVYYKVSKNIAVGFEMRPNISYTIIEGFKKNNGYLYNGNNSLINSNSNSDYVFNKSFNYDAMFFSIGTIITLPHIKKESE